jgi:hypothetical protein
MDRAHARTQTERHRAAQRLIGARFADAGFDVRLGLYRLPEDCYGFAATGGGLGDNTAPAPAAPDEDRLGEQPKQQSSQEGGEPNGDA